MDGQNTFLSRFFSLRWAFAISVVVPLAAAAALTGYLTIRFLEDKVEQRMQKDLELVARAIQLPLSHSLELNREGSIAQALESAFSIGKVYGVYVYDQEGQQVASAGRVEPEPEKEKLTELAAYGEERGEYGHVAGRKVYSYFVPLTDSGGRVNGLLQLTRRESDFQEDIRAMRANGAIGLAAAMLLMSGLVFYGHHRAMGRYFSSLITSMSRVAEGERSHRFTPHGPTEIVSIGLQFNHMLDRIEAAQKELRQRRDRQEQLKTQLRQAEKLAAIGQLAAGVAHELGTPLGVVSGKAQRALRNKNLDQDVSGALKDIRGEVRRMEHIIRQLLDFSRHNTLRKKPASLGRLAHASLSAVAQEAFEHDVQLEMQETERDTMVHVDSVHIVQALVNLLRNAIQSAPAGKVILSWGLEPGQAWMQVDDNGPGIPEEIRNKLFEPFFTTKEVGAGTGLGLAVVHGIIEEHEGELEFGESHLGGAFFRFRLPVHQTPTEDEKA